MTRIFLVGFMASGKTTLGKALARDLGLAFIDMDTYIENRFHKTVGELFTERGEDGFRLLEHNMLSELVGFEDVVIATGGGAPCYFDNMELMNDAGITVWLQASIEVLLTRLTINRSRRPLVKEKSGDELREYITTTLAQRAPFYSKATHTFCADTLEDIHQVSASVARFKEEILGMEKE